MGRKRQRNRSESPESRRHRRRQRRDGAPAPSPLLSNDKSDPRRQTDSPDQQLVTPPASGRKNPQQLRRSPRKLAGATPVSFSRDRRDTSSTEEEVDELDDEWDQLDQEDGGPAPDGLVVEDSELERQAAESDSDADSTDEEHAEASSRRATRGIKANYLDRGSDSAASTSSDESVTEFSDSSGDDEGGNRSSSPSSELTLRDDSASSIACSTESDSDGMTDESRTPRGRRRRRLHTIAVPDSDSESTASSSIVVASRTPRRSPRRFPSGRSTGSPSLSARRTPRSSLISTPRRDRFFYEPSPLMHEAFVRPNDPEMRAVDKAYRKQAQSDHDYTPSSDSDCAGRSRRGGAQRGRPPRRSIIFLPDAELDDAPGEHDDGDDGEVWLGCDPDAQEKDLSAAEGSDRALDPDSDDGWDVWDWEDEESSSPRGDEHGDDWDRRDEGDVSSAGELVDDSPRQDEGYASQAGDKPCTPPGHEPPAAVPARRGARPSQNIRGRYENLGWTIEGAPAPHPCVRFHGLGAASPVYDPRPPPSPKTEEELKSLEVMQRELDEWADAYNKRSEEFVARMMQNVPPGWGDSKPVDVAAAEQAEADEEEEEEVDQLADSDELEYADPPPRRRRKR